MSWMVCWLLGLVPVLADDADARAELAKHQGTWEVVSFVREGEETPKEIASTITRVVEDDHVVWHREGKSFAGTKIKLDPSKTPKAADWTITTEGELKGKTARGIYDVDKDTWKHCFGFDKRPEKFESKAGSKVTNAVLKRVKK